MFQSTNKGIQTCPNRFFSSSCPRRRHPSSISSSVANANDARRQDVVLPAASKMHPGTRATLDSVSS